MSFKISIYQTFPRLFGNKNKHCIPNGTMHQNGCGKFNDFTDRALTEIRNLGITHIWYTGVIEHGTMTDYSKFGIQNDHPTLIKGRAGSPYAIKDYYDVDPDLAENVGQRMKEFEALIYRTHQSGLKIIIDFVPNHLFRQYHSDQKPEGIKNFGEDDDANKPFDPRNNFYYLTNTSFKLPEDIAWLKKIEDELPALAYTEIPAKATGNDKFEAQPDKNDWYETIKLNYGVDVMNHRTGYFSPLPDTWNKMLDVLNFWARKGVDAFRCDMAEMVPVEFWEWAIHQVKEKFPHIIFIAEVYNPFEYHNYVKRGGFDYLYDKVGLYDTLKSILRHQSSTTSISSCWQVLEGLDAHMLRFLENHDEVRFASTEFAGNPEAAIPAMTVSAGLNTGPVMIYNGQEVGETAKGAAGFSGDDGRTTIYDYFNMPGHQKWMNEGKFDGELLTENQKKLRRFYQQILNISIKNEAIATGKFYDLMYAQPFDILPNRDKIYTWLRYTENQKLLFVTHFDGNLKNRIKIRIPHHAFGEMGLEKNNTFKVQGLLRDNSSREIKKETLIVEGIEVTFDGFDAVIFELTGI
ncbi:MAG: alpha-amylase family protein [Bacteroidales bacterium]|nr:alpha-amylase family protein [Bacteroidales bacterium]